jgi:hypothetical protein
MSGIQLTGTFTDTNLPVDLDTNAAMLADSNLLQWFQGDASAVVFGTSPYIQNFVDKKGTGVQFTQLSQTNQASLVASQINGFPAAVFTGGTNSYSDMAGQLSLLGSFTINFVGTFTSTSASSGLFSIGTTTSGIFIEARTNGTISFTLNGNTIQGNYAVGLPTTLTASFNMSAGVMKLRVNGVNYATTTSSANTVTTVALIGSYVGGGINMVGTLSDIQFRNDDMSANATALATWMSFTKNVYNVAG